MPEYDESLNILKKDISTEFNLPFGSITENIKFCSDDSKCFFGPEKISDDPD